VVSAAFAPCGPWSLFSPMGEFVECCDSSPHGSESGDKSPYSPIGGLNDDHAPIFNLIHRKQTSRSVQSSKNQLVLKVKSVFLLSE